MDRGRQVLRRVAAGFILLVAACASAPEADAPLTHDSLRVLRWIAPDADTVDAVTMRPVACAAPDELVNGVRSQPSQQRELGRLAFESPALLGGAAARMGLSCSSCHLNGRGNASFFVDGVSVSPGTADVTSSLFSKTRGNGVFDPVPIPDLAARDGKQIRDRKSHAFRDKVHGLIVEEFDGQEPPPVVFEAVLAYLDSLDIAQCRNPAGRVQAAYSDDYAAMLSAMAVLAPKDVAPDVALFYIRVARERLERLHERFPPGGQAARDLEAMSARFAQAADDIRAGKPFTLPIADMGTLVAHLFGEAPNSLYNPDVLRAALARSPRP